jgi:hypothetical protein
MSTLKSCVVLAILAATVAGLDAQGRATLVRPPRQGVFLAEPWRPALRGDTKIIGQVIDIRQVPVCAREGAVAKPHQRLGTEKR